MSDLKFPFGPSRAHAGDMYKAPPVVKSVAGWVDQMRHLPQAGTRPASPEVLPPVKHKVDFTGALAPTRRTRRIR